jgi:uncharacterized repeat protein (TIGR01451 family)
VRGSGRLRALISSAVMLALLAMAATSQQAIAQTQSLTTTFERDMADRRGNMFDIDVLSNDIVLEAFDIHLNTTNTNEIDLYFRPGSFVGHEGSPDGWTLYYTGTVQGAGSGNPTRFTIPDLTLERNQTYALYFRASSVNLRQTRFDDVGAVYVANADLQIRAGYAIVGTFGSNRDRVWNGTIFYSVLPSVEADAGPDQTVASGASVTLNGAASEPAGEISYSWSQTGGPGVTLTGADTVSPSFTAPTLSACQSDAILTFSLDVTDGSATDTDSVIITVTPPPCPGGGTGGSEVNEYNDPNGEVTWRAHSFFGNDTLTLSEPTDVEYLIVGGGGGAAAGGGGGGGGMRTGNATSVSGEQPILVGAGGAGGIGSFPDSPQQSGGSNGGNSEAFGVVALGGGGGGTYFSDTSPAAWAGLAGGSGGGASHTGPGGAAGSNDQGNAGATGQIGCGASSGGGGGGAGQPGFVGTSSQGGRGGDGASSAITGSLVYYAGGGAGGGDDRDNFCNYTGNPGVIPNEGGLGGGGASTSTNGQPGTDGLGGGGGGAQLNTSVYSGGNGGSGIVVVRYVINTAPNADAGDDAHAFAGQEVTLDGSASSDPENNITSYSWSQTGGTPVLPAGANTAQVSFTPAQPADNEAFEILEFELTVTDAFGLTSTDQVTITLNGLAVLSASKDVSVISEAVTACDEIEAQPPAEPENPAAIPGACIQYLITVTNDGPVAASAISLVDELPIHLAFQTAELSGDWGTETVLATPNCPGATCQIQVQDGVLDAGKTGTIFISATIK